MAVSLNPGMKLHVAGDLGILLEFDGKSRLPCLAIIARLGFPADRTWGHGSMGRIQIKLVILSSGQGEFLLRAICLIVVLKGVHNFQAYPGGKLPAITDIFKIAVEKALQILQSKRAVSIRPFKIPVRPQPFLGGTDPPEPLNGTAAMKVIPAYRGVWGYLDIFPSGYLVFPVFVHERIFFRHGNYIIDIAHATYNSYNVTAKLTRN